METNFTPGPWRLVDKVTENKLYCMILARDSSSNTPREFEVLTIGDSHPVKDHITRRHSDAHLIAAAPEMYALLKELDDFTDSEEGDFRKTIIDIAVRAHLLLTRINQQP